MMARLSEALPALRVGGLDQDARGVGRHDGKVVFVHGALPGELVAATVYRRRRRFDEARLEHVLEASPQRVVPRCEHFGICGGCSLQHLSTSAQVAHKQADVLDKLAHIGGVEPGEVHDPILGPTWHYRRKARLGCKHVPGKGGVLVGFRERGRSFIADIRRCHVLVPEVGERIEALRALLDTLDARDAIPQIEIAAGDDLTLLVVRHLRPLTDPDRERLRRFAHDTGLAVALQPGGPETVQGLEPQDVPELGYRLQHGGFTLGFEALDFVQVNAAVNDALVRAAVAALAPRDGETVLDLFCGLGNFSLAIAATGARVVALELAAAMVARARENAVRNGLERRIEVHAADLGDPEQARRWLDTPATRLLLDPPRTGAAEIVDALPATGHERLVYVSCNPATLARDAAVLTRDKGYVLSSVRVVDMFPHTSHVESLAVFDR